MLPAMRLAIIALTLAACASEPDELTPLADDFCDWELRCLGIEDEPIICSDWAAACTETVDVEDIRGCFTGPSGAHLSCTDTEQCITAYGCPGWH